MYAYLLWHLILFIIVIFIVVIIIIFFFSFDADFNQTYRLIWARTCIMQFMHMIFFLRFCQHVIKHSNPIQ